MRSPRHPYLFFFNDTATTEIYTLSLHDALPIFLRAGLAHAGSAHHVARGLPRRDHRVDVLLRRHAHVDERSEEHTSELQSRQYLVCRLLLEKKNKYYLAAANVHG